MHGLRYFLAFLIALIGATAVLAEQNVTIGVLAFRPKAQMGQSTKALQIALAAKLPGRAFTIEPMTYAELNDAIGAGKLDFVLTNPGHYIFLRERHALSSPMATVVSNAQGKALLDVFGGVIFSRADAGIESLADLKTRKIAATSTESLGGFLMQAFELKKAGIPVSDDTPIIQTGMPHDKVVEAVLNGQADVGFVRTGILESMVAEKKLDLARLRIIDARPSPDFPLIHSTRLYPEWAFCATRAADRQLAGQVAAALLTLRDMPATTLGVNAHGFVIPRDYSGVENILREMRVAPFDTPEVTLPDIARQYSGELLALTVLALALAVLYARLLRTRHMLAKQHQAMSNILWGTGVGTWEWNVQTGALVINARWAEIVGLRLEDLKPVTFETWNRLLHQDDRSLSETQLQRHFAGETEHYECELRMRRRDGDWVWVLDRGKVITRTPDGKPEWMAGTHLDITERKAAEEELERYRRNLERLVQERTADLSVAKDVAVAADRAKTVFLANMSHELRTPLNGILGMISLAQRRMSDERGQSQLAHATTSANRLLDLLSNLLDISRLEGDRLTLEKRCFRLSCLLAQINQSIGQRAADKGLAFSTHCPEELTQRVFAGDPRRLGQIIRNLLENALAFTEMGHIALRIACRHHDPERSELQFAIEDSGTGIAEEAMRRIFSPFEQADNSQTRRHGGAGLGLAISDRLVKLMGGTMQVYSAPGEGSTFTFTVMLENEDASRCAGHCCQHVVQAKMTGEPEACWQSAGNSCGAGEV